MQFDAEYLARSVARLSGIPVRVYEGETLLFSFFPVPLPKDPMELCREEVFSVQGHVGYYASPLFHCYGVLNAADLTVLKRAILDGIRTDEILHLGDINSDGTIDKKDVKELIRQLTGKPEDEEEQTQTTDTTGVTDTTNTTITTTSTEYPVLMYGPPRAWD